MVIAGTCAEPIEARYSRRLMNARAVANLVGAKPGTLNAWIARGYIPGLDVGVSGKRRDIDTETATRIAIFAQLVGFGVSADFASTVVGVVGNRNLEARFVVVPAPHEEVIIPPRGERFHFLDPDARSPTGILSLMVPAPSPRWPLRRFDLPAELPADLTEEEKQEFESKWQAEQQAQRVLARVVFSDAGLRQVFADVEPPLSFLVVDVGTLVQRVRAAEQEWNERRQGKGQ